MAVLPLRPGRRGHGAAIPLVAFDAAQRAILARAPSRGRAILPRDLVDAVRATVPPAIAGSLSASARLTAAVTLDCESRGLLERMPGGGPARYRRPLRG